MLHIDHFTLGTDRLDKGIDTLEALIGARIGRGGKHPLMSTHNGLTATGERQFMELIAIDPDVPPPDRTRWFSLDEPRTIKRLAERPRALCWVVETDNLDDIIANSPLDLGEPIALSRDDRTWRLTVPQDGSLPEQGLLPAFIEWSPGPHPSTVQADIGMRLEGVHLTHPDPAWLTETCIALGIAHLVQITKGAHALAFEVTTPKGRLILD